jgi:hypothetical protein
MVEWNKGSTEVPQINCTRVIKISAILGALIKSNLALLAPLEEEASTLFRQLGLPNRGTRCH